MGELSTNPEVLSAASRSTGPIRIKPRALAQPTTLDEIRELTRMARAEGRSLTTRGAATGMPGGNVGPDLVVEMMTGFSTIEEPDLANKTIVAGAGAILGDVAKIAATHGLDLPPMPSSAALCSVGGAVANNAAGARSFGHGAIRDWVLDVEAVLGDGSVIRLDGETHHPGLNKLRVQLGDRWPQMAPDWPQVRKNSSGYAIPEFLASNGAAQLLTGSEGTLGIVTRTRFRLREAPAARGVGLVALPAVEDLLPVIAAARRVGASACEFFGQRFLAMADLSNHPTAGPIVGRAWGMILVEVEGTDQRVLADLDGLAAAWRALGFRFTMSADPSEVEALWAIRRDASPTIAARAKAGQTSVQFVEDSVVPVENLPQYLTDLDRILDTARIEGIVFGHAGDGNVHVNPLIDFRDPNWKAKVRGILEGVAESVARCGGTLSGEHGDGRIRAPLLDRIWSSEAISAFHLIKDSLDPHGVLNPGVILPTPGQDPLSGMGPGS